MIRRVVLCLAAAAAPVAAQAEPGSIAVGVRGGVEVHRGGWGPQHFGLQVWIPLRDRFNVVPALDLLHEFPDDPLGAWSGRAWRGYLTLQGASVRMTSAFRTRFSNWSTSGSTRFATSPTQSDIVETAIPAPLRA